MANLGKIDIEDIQKLENLTKEIIEIKKNLRIGTTSLTPLNYLEEMEKFFNSDTYNPFYIYKKQELPDYTKELEKLKITISKFHIPLDIKEYFLEFLNDQNMLYLTKQNIGKNDFSKYANLLFNWDNDMLDFLLINTLNVKFKMQSAHNMQDAVVIKKRMEKALLRYKIDSFIAEIDNFSPHIINVSYKKIKIGKSIYRYECNVDRLIVHEIESHVLQTENLKRSPNFFVELCKYADKNLYSEGLAVYNEILTRKITPDAFETYYYRVKAVRLLHKSFREIYEILSENLNPQKAFVMTYRVKRGLSDTSLPGGFPKDAAYLLGYHEVENWRAKKYPRKLLYATKSPILTTLLEKYNLIDTKNLITPKFYR